jgi:hypothetical protein
VQPELTILKLFLNHTHWETHGKYLSAKDFPEDLQFIYRTVDSFHKTQQDPINLSVADLSGLL